jgi:hypothetical protein
LIPKDVDAEVDQLEDYVDKSLQYRVQIKSVHLKKQKIKKFTHFYLQYGFFKERSSTKTSLFELSNTNTIAPNAPVNIEQEFFHYVVVNDAFIRYCCNNTIVIEVMVTRQ